MFIKLTRSGGRSYAQLVESFRDEQGRPRQRTLATLGRTDEVGGQVDALLQGLARVKGRPAGLVSPVQVQFESALALGEPDVDPDAITHQHLLRSMDALMDHQCAVDDCVAQLLRPLIDEQLSVVFYDLTTIRVEGLSQQGGDVRKFGMSKEGIIARQFMLGVVQTADGLPIYHEVFDGNASEGRTLKPALERVLQRYPHVRRLVVVADRGLLSLDNLQMLSELKLAGDRALEFILAVPGRRHGDFVDLLAPLQAKAEGTTAETIEELRWQGHRLVVAHNPEQAQHLTQRRRDRIAALQARAQAMDGKLLLVSNVPDLSAQQIVARYKSLADIERGFHVLKSEIEIAPVFHRLPERIRAHARASVSWRWCCTG